MHDQRGVVTPFIALRQPADIFLGLAVPFEQALENVGHDGHVAEAARFPGVQVHGFLTESQTQDRIIGLSLDLGDQPASANQIHKAGVRRVNQLRAACGGFFFVRLGRRGGRGLLCRRPLLVRFLACGRHFTASGKSEDHGQSQEKCQKTLHFFILQIFISTPSGLKLRTVLSFSL